MSGAHVPWTREQRAARSALMKARWADPVYRQKALAQMIERANTPEQIERSRQKMFRWHERRKACVYADAHWRAAIWSANGRPKKRELMRELMKATMARPEMIEHNKRLGKQTAHKKLNGTLPRKRRGGLVPERFQMLYLELRKKKIPARQAYLYVKDHERRQDART